jgi:hypothetical protein
VVGASGITIDLNGFALQGDHSVGRYGIDDTKGFDRVTVKDGLVRDFDDGLVGFGANPLILSGLVASGNTNGGIFVAGGSTRVQSSNVSGNGGDGVYILGTSTTVQSSTGNSDPAQCRPRSLC